ncbi:hypothetical protein EIW28_16470 [Glycomyces terrestris]|uniref:Low affinity iron permease family protein n=2 Tax=Glycomyces terrestris TaxID=2493553 RepID=A0A426UWQ6_9ACTN|nr:hypothetical protein EIW28_16470 [Glycomyces terrestris]
MPSDVSAKVGFFDHLASHVADFASRAWFFSCCVLLVLLWAPLIIFFDFDTWQLIINTPTTIITFLMVALLQNTQSRNEKAVQHKLNAMADALSHLMNHVGEDSEDLRKQKDELRRAVGLEDRESA